MHARFMLNYRYVIAHPARISTVVRLFLIPATNYLHVRLLHTTSAFLHLQISLRDQASLPSFD